MFYNYFCKEKICDITGIQEKEQKLSAADEKAVLAIEEVKVYK